MYELLSIHLVKSNPLLQFTGKSHETCFLVIPLSWAVLFDRPGLVAANSVSLRKVSMKVCHLRSFPLTLCELDPCSLLRCFYFFPFSSDRVICMQCRKLSDRKPPKDRQPVYLIANQPATWFLEQRSNWLGILSVSLADANKQACLLTIYLQNIDWFQERNITSLCKEWANDFFRSHK